MLNRTCRYALRILAHLARHRGELVPGEQIAEHTGVPANYLSKILNQLRKHGIVDSRKGWHGGFELRPDAVDRPIKDILVALEGADSLDKEGCLFGLSECDGDNPCPLHGHWEQIRGTYTAMLCDTRVGDLASSQ